MVTPENGTLTFQGASGKRYTVSIYIADVVGTICPMDINGIAGTASSNFWIAPENVQLVDASITTGNTVTKALVPRADDVNMGSIISIANSISTLANRVSPGMGWQKGRKVTFVEA